MKKALPWLRNRSVPEEHGQEIGRGAKTLIREKRIDDAPDDYSWRVDEELARLAATRPLRMSYDDFLRFSEEELRYASDNSKRLAIDTHDGQHIGNCMYYDIDLRRKRAELGIMIGDKQYWGKGYGTDAVKTLLSHVFTKTEIDFIYLHTLEWNQRARRAFEKAGLREVKKVRRGGLDFIEMEISRIDWEQKGLPDTGATDTGSHRAAGN